MQDPGRTAAAYRFTGGSLYLKYGFEVILERGIQEAVSFVQHNEARVGKAGLQAGLSIQEALQQACYALCFLMLQCLLCFQVVN